MKEVVGCVRPFGAKAPRESRQSRTGQSEMMDGHIPPPAGPPRNPSSPDCRDMPHDVAVICEQTAQEPALCCRDCGRILRCIIPGSAATSAILLTKNPRAPSWKETARSNLTTPGGRFMNRGRRLMQTESGLSIQILMAGSVEQR